MSGPKGIQYQIMQEQERQRRRLKEAQERLRHLRIEHAAAGASLEAMGGVPHSVVESSAVSLEEIQAQSKAFECAIKNIKVQVEQKLQSRQREAAERIVNSVLSTIRIDPALNLGESSAKWNQEMSQGNITAAEVSNTCAAEDPVIVYRAQDLLSRQIEPNPAIAKEIEELLRGRRATAELALSDISHRIEAANKIISQRRAQEEAIEQARQEAAIEAAGEAADREYVLTALRESLEELGYSVAGTTVENPASLVLGTPEHAEYGLKAGVNSLDREIYLRPVQIAEGATSSKTIAFEEDFCKDMPELTKEMARKGVKFTHIRSTPIGAVAAPPQKIVPVATRSSRKARARTEKRQGRVNKA